MTPFVEQEFLPSIPNDRSIERFGQIQKLLFQRTFLTGTTKNVIVDPTAIATFTPLLTAEDGSKVSVSPFLSEPVNESGEARTYGGGNATLNGIPILLGREASPFSGKFLDTKQTVIAELEKLQHETLSVIFINEHGQLGMWKDGDDYQGIPIQQFFLSDKKFGNFEEVDSNSIQFYLKPGWSQKFVVVTPDDFDALNDLANQTEVGS